MSRIRTIKPEFPQSESIGAISRSARLLFIQLWTICDDHGRCRAAKPYLVGQLYPYDDDAAEEIGGWLSELADEGLIYLYQVEGKSYLEVPGWAEHQRVDNAGKPRVPAPLVSFAEFRRNSPRKSETLEKSPLDLGPRPEWDGSRERARESDFRQEIVETFERAGQPPPDTSHAVVWLRQGRDPDICLGVIGDILSRRPGIRALKYFDQPIADAHTTPAGKSNARAGPPRQSNGSKWRDAIMGSQNENRPDDTDILDLSANPVGAESPRRAGVV